MARQKKKGLDYFPLDVDFFSDTKIKLLKARFGADGITIYVYLLCEIYKNGYYVKADEDFQYIMSDDLNMSIDKVKQVLKFLLERSLLDSKLFQSDTILTSTGIQRRFQLAVKERAKKNPIEITGFWLLKESETEPFIKVTHFEDKSQNFDDFSGKNKDNSREKSLKKSKVNNNIYYSNPELENVFQMYINMRKAGKDGITQEQIGILLDELNEIGKDDQERIAIVKKAFASGWKSFYPLRKKTEKKGQTNISGKKNQFHNFDQREYDYGKLEQAFIEKANERKR